MKKLLLLFVSVIAIITVQAQVSEADRNLALQLVTLNKERLGLSDEDIRNAFVAATYTITDTDIRMVYLQQQHKGVPVYNQLKTLAFRHGTAVSNMGDFVSSVDKLTDFAGSVPAITPAQALQAALAEVNVAVREIPAPLKVSDDGQKYEYGTLGVSSEKINAALIWVPHVTGRYHLAWQVFIAPLNDTDYWLIRIDAQTGAFLNKESLTVTCQWNHEKHSVQEHFAQDHQKRKSITPAFTSENKENYVEARKDQINRLQYRLPLINTATYTVIRYPAESPQHPGGLPSTHTDPWTLVPGNATTLQWHSDPADYAITRGNNVWAYADRTNNNNPAANPAGNSQTPLPSLTFNYVYDFTKSPIDPTSDNQQAAIVNLFYMNNLMHDMSYKYGFDEVSGNFQNDNLGRGGVGTDYVLAEAQDGGGTNNANFSTPAVDGSARPRMQMYLWTLTTPNRDGDLDNGIIAHEYGHGISLRLTGGPTINCLSNQEQAGEGWSDYMSLMMGTNWSTATINDGPIRRGIGTYALGQPITGQGIRRFPYSTDMSIYPLTYANLPGSAVPHGVGEIWCMMLWEMTWEIIKQDNYIETNFLNPPGPVSTWRGNAAAMKLVMEGMRLQPCSPGFVDSRNAILRADTLFFNARYSCAIWKAFAKRGLGRFASQGLATSITDGVPDFTLDDGSMSLTQNAPQMPELQNIVYRNTHTAGECTPYTNFFTTDTLPNHVTWVSGGTYNPVDRTVTFSGINLLPGQSVTNIFTVNINAGSYFPTVTAIDDPVTAIAPNWTATSTTANVWTTSSASVRSAPLAFFTPNAAVTSDQILRTANPITIPSFASAITTLSFWHRYVTEANWDGCVVEISTDGGATWSDLGPFMSGARYNATLNTSPNPLSGRQAFSGNVGTSFVQTRINLSSFAGQTVLIRFRLGSDNLVSSTGWYIDDILLESKPYVYMKTNLFNASGGLESTRDTLTLIRQASDCLPGITGHPSNVTTCSGLNASFTVVATGVPVTYQWMLSTDGGTTWTNISGATSDTYTINGVTVAMNGHQFRCEVTGTCGVDTSNAATLTVNPSPTHTSITATPSSICTTTTGASTITATVTGGTMTSGVYTHTLAGPGTIVQNPPSGPNNSNASFSVSNIPPGNHVYTLTSTDEVGCSVASTVNVDVLQTPVISVNPTAATICAGNVIPLSVSTGVTRTFSSTTPITIPAGAPGTTSGPASPYPATITVSGLPTSGVTVKSVTINGVVHTFPDDIDILLQSPTGVNVVLMSDVGGSADNTGENYTFDDAAASLMADAALNPSGTYRPTNYGATDTWAAPGPGAITQATPAISMFGTGDMNGVWSLFVVDDLAGDVGAINSWSITFNVAGAVFSPTTGLFTDAAATVPYTGTPVHGTIYASPATTTTYTVNAANGACAATPVNVTITVNPNPVHSNVVANPSLICTSTTAATTITGTASGGTVSGLQVSSGTINLAIPDNVPAGVNSNITLPPGTTISAAGNLSVRLNIQHTWVGDLRVTLTGPCGTTFVFDRPGVPATTFGNSADLNGIYVFTLSAATIIPETGGGPVIPPGNYLPSNNANPGVAHNWAGITFPCNAAGTWTLNVSDNAGGDLGTLFEWAILLAGTYTHSLTGPGTIVQNPPSGPNNANASFSVSNIPVGVHTYTLTTTDGVGCLVSTPVTVTVGQNPNVVVTPPSVTICQGESATLRIDTTRVFTNTTPMTIPATGTGATTGAPANPYPSVINVSGLPTTGVRVRSVTISGISHTFPDDIDMLLQSPGGVNVILMSDVGGTNDFINNTFTFDDAAASLMSDAGVNPSGTYRPTNYVTPDNFPAPGPGSITQATPALSMFGYGNMNGAWNLFVVDDLGGDVGTMQGWSITFDIVGVGLVTYSWSPAAGLNTTSGPVVIATPATTTTYTATATTALGCTGSGTSTVTVISTVITSQPTSIAACAGENRTFVVVATGLNLSYQWQISTDGGATWTNIAGAIFPNLTLTNLTLAMNGNQYRCIISGCGAPVTSNAATLTIYSPVVITTQPANATVCAGANVTFTVAATGTPTPLHYQWQVSTNAGVTYTNIAGANGTSLTLTNVTTALNQNRYRCVVTGYCGVVNSNAAILTVNALTTLSVSPLPSRICLSDTLVALSGTPVGGVWSGVGVIGNNFLPFRTAVGTYTLTYTFTNASGCTSTATLTAKVEDCPERRRLLRDDAVILYPNPNNGQFNIRINSTLYSYLGIKVYAANGALVHTQNFTGLQYGRVVPVDLRKLAAGVYNVKVYYDDGVRTSEKTFKIIIGTH